MFCFSSPPPHSRTHASGYNNETYVIGTTGTIHVGRFAGYPGPIHVEVWKSDGTQDVESSRTFSMADMRKGVHHAEYLPRFRDAFAAAHEAFRAAIFDDKPFAVTQRDVLDAQVLVEAAALSAQLDGKPLQLQRADSVADYRQQCIDAGVLIVK